MAGAIVFHVWRGEAANTPSNFLLVALALIGPNDSGKSTILRGLRTVVQFAGGSFSGGGVEPFDPRLPAGPDSDAEVELTAWTQNAGYGVKSKSGRVTEEVTLLGPPRKQISELRDRTVKSGFGPPGDKTEGVMSELRGVRLPSMPVRFAPGWPTQARQACSARRHAFMLRDVRPRSS